MLSTTAHGLLLLYRKHGTAFIPAQLYHAIQTTVNSVYLLTSLAQQYCPHMDFYYFLTGTNEEEKLFCCFRTMTHSHNFDMLQLGERAGAVIGILDVLLRNPRWNRMERRLKPESDDKVNVASWRGDLSVKGVSVPFRWRAGRDSAIELFNNHPYWQEQGVSAGLFDQLHRDGVTTLRPSGVLVGVSRSADDPEEEEAADAPELPPASTEGGLQEEDGLLEDMLTSEGRSCALDLLRARERAVTWALL